MTYTLNVYKGMDLQIGGEPIVRGSRSAPIAISVDGVTQEFHKQVLTTAIWNVWQAGGDVIPDFDYLWIETDQDVELELTCDFSGNVGTVVFAFSVKSGRPFDLLSDDAWANYTANFASGTLDVIDRIRIKNTSGSTANIRVLLVT